MCVRKRERCVSVYIYLVMSAYVCVCVAESTYVLAHIYLVVCMYVAQIGRVSG